MPYDPTAPTDDERSNVFFLVGLGLAANTLLLIAYAVPLGDSVLLPALLVTGATIFVSIFTNRYDDYFAALRDAGLRWGMAVIALYLFAEGIASVLQGGHLVGRMVGSGTVPGDADIGRLFSVDALPLAITASLAYHLGFVVTRMRRG